MSTDSKLALERWKLKKIAELGRDGFEVFSKRTMSRGHLLHKRIEHYLLHQELPEIASSDHPEDDEISANHLRSITPILKDFTKPFALESRVVHPVLKYQGQYRSPHEVNIFFVSYQLLFYPEIISDCHLCICLSQGTPIVLPSTRASTSV